MRRCGGRAPAHGVYGSGKAQDQARFYREHRGKQSGRFCHEYGLLHLQDQAEGVIIYDEPREKPEKMPNYDTLALYDDGHVESLQSKERSAQEYIDGGASQVYTFGPCIVRDGTLTEYIATANRSNNPRHAFGMVEPGHYIDVICEGRVGKSKTMMRSTGVMMENLAQMMIDRGCEIAVNLDGGQTAVMAFMGKQLNRVVKSDPKGRKETEVLAFGTSESVKPQ